MHKRNLAFSKVHIIVDFRQDSSYYFNDKFVILIKRTLKKRHEPSIVKNALLVFFFYFVLNLRVKIKIEV